MTPEQVIQSLELQSAQLKDRMLLMPAASHERQIAEQTLKQYDAQLARTIQEFNKKGSKF